jgi:hypothetical protein
VEHDRFGKSASTFPNHALLALELCCSLWRTSEIKHEDAQGDSKMTRSRIAIAAVFASLLAAAAPAALVQTPGDSATAPKASKMTTRERINDMMSKWR